MAKIKTVTAKYGVTVNLGDYNNIKLELELEVEVEPGDDPEMVKRETQNQVMNEVNMRAKAIKQEQAKQGKQ